MNKPLTNEQAADRIATLFNGGFAGSGYYEEALRMAESALRAQGDEPDMFWNADDPERCRENIANVIEYEWSDGTVQVGDTMEIQRAVRLSNIKVRIIADPLDDDGFAFEVIDAAPHHQGEEHGG